MGFNVLMCHSETTTHSLTDVLCVHWDVKLYCRYSQTMSVVHDIFWTF